MTDKRAVIHGDKKVVVQPATYANGVTRTILIQRAREAEAGRAEPANLEDPAVLASYFIRHNLYPSFIAATAEHEGFDHWPITPEELEALPEGFVVEWEQAVAETNPQWFPNAGDSDPKNESGSG